MKKALFLSESRRVYRPDEAPDDVREKALCLSCEGLEPEWISESVFGTCKETGLQGEEADRGIRLETSGRDRPTWADPFCKSYGVGMVGRVDDIPKFLAYLATEGHLDRNDVRRLQYVERDGGLSLTFHKRRGYGEGTVSDFEAGSVEHDSTMIEASIETLEVAWSEYVEALERRAVQALRAEIEYLTSWAPLAERLKDFGEGLDENGRTVSISECEEKDLPQDETDEAD